MSGKSSHKKVLIITGIAAAVMFGFSFALVPLYSLICKQTGINTSVPNNGLLTQVSETPTEPADLSRTVTVQFVAINHNGMPWNFIPRTKTIDVHPGENNKIFFYAKNPTGRTMSAQAIPSMTPVGALSHFHKVVCFCFNQQTLKAGEEKEMPMIFRIDNQLPKDVRVITLAYTLYDTSPKETQQKDIRKG